MLTDRIILVTLQSGRLVTPCALTSCHVVISKQNRTIRALRSSRCVTGRRPRDENHAVRFRQSAENRCRARDTQPIRDVSDVLSRGVQALAPPGSWKKIWEEEVLSLIYVSPSSSQTTTYKEVFVHWSRKSSLIMFPLVFVLRLYNSRKSEFKSHWVLLSFGLLPRLSKKT